MARKKNTTNVIEEAIEAEMTEVTEETVVEDAMIEEAVTADKPAKRKSGLTGSLLVLLLGSIAGVFASPHIAPMVPDAIGKYLKAGGTEANGAEVESKLSELTQRLGSVETGLSGISEKDWEAQISEMKLALVNQPKSIVTEGGGVDLGAIQAELDALKAQNAELSATIDEKLSTKIAEADAQVETAQKAEHTAAATMAIAKLRVSALDGRGIADDLQQLRDAGVEVPDEISALSDGVSSATSLEAEFGDYAIEAIRASVVASTGDQGGFFADAKAKLSSQFAGRSTTPQEGVTPDAILSRAEDHLRKGDLEQSIVELSALPSEALAIMAPWIENAEKRLTLILAIDALEKSATGN